MTLAAFGEAGAGQRGDTPVRPLDLSGRERQLRAAMTAMDRIGAAFVRYARRSMPFLARHHGRIVATPVQIASMTADPPRFSAAMIASPRESAIEMPPSAAWPRT